MSNLPSRAPAPDANLELESTCHPLITQRDLQRYREIWGGAVAWQVAMDFPEVARALRTDTSLVAHIFDRAEGQLSFQRDFST